MKLHRLLVPRSMSGIELEIEELILKNVSVTQLIRKMTCISLAAVKAIDALFLTRNEDDDLHGFIFMQAARIGQHFPMKD